MRDSGQPEEVHCTINTAALPLAKNLLECILSLPKILSLPFP